MVLSVHFSIFRRRGAQAYARSDEDGTVVHGSEEMGMFDSARGWGPRAL